MKRWWQRTLGTIRHMAARFMLSIRAKNVAPLTRSEKIRITALLVSALTMFACIPWRWHVVGATSDDGFCMNCETHHVPDQPPTFRPVKTCYGYSDDLLGFSLALPAVIMTTAMFEVGRRRFRRWQRLIGATVGNTLSALLFLGLMTAHNHGCAPIKDYPAQTIYFSLGSIAVCLGVGTLVLAAVRFIFIGLQKRTTTSTR